MRRIREALKHIWSAVHRVVMFLPMVPEGCIIPFGFSCNEHWGPILRVPLFLCWRDFSVQYRRQVWGTLNMIATTKRVRFFWSEFEEQPKVL
jgi:hypothetical protein